MYPDRVPSAFFCGDVMMQLDRMAEGRLLEGKKDRHCDLKAAMFRKLDRTVVIAECRAKGWVVLR